MLSKEKLLLVWQLTEERVPCDIRSTRPSQACGLQEHGRYPGACFAHNTISVGLATTGIKQRNQHVAKTKHMSQTLESPQSLIPCCCCLWFLFVDVGFMWTHDKVVFVFVVVEYAVAVDAI